MQDPNLSIVNGQFYRHVERENGTRDLFYGPVGQQDHNHAVIDPMGRPLYIREDGQVIANQPALRDDPPAIRLNY